MGPMGTGVSGPEGICILTKSLRVPLPVSPLFTAVVWMREFMSSIKASVMICFARHLSNDCLGIDLRSDYILCVSTYRNPQGTRRQRWDEGTWPHLTLKALKGSCIAAVQNSTRLHLFYQDPELRVRHFYNEGRANWYDGEWILALSLSRNESSLHCRFPGLWHTTVWNAHNG